MTDQMTDPTDVPPPFVTYTRQVQQTKRVAEVTAENVAQIAALIGGQVDYSSGEPILVIPGRGNGPWRVKVGSTLGLMPGNPPALQNENGFNRDGDWQS